MNRDAPNEATVAARDCWFLVGPTASGKTPIGIELAQRIGAEIVSLDSMAVYRGMDIGTAKPSPALRQVIPHHLIDIANPDEDFSVHDYVQAAERTVGEITDRGREVLFVGGTPLYLKALLRGFADGPTADWSFRQAVEEELRTVGQQALHERLALVDPLAASRLHPNDTRRLIRALEFYRATGTPISHAQMQFDEGGTASQYRVFVVDRPREIVHQRIEARVAAMFDAGLVEEVRGLTGGGQAIGRTASQAVGYREVLEHLAGHCDMEEVVRRVRTRTRRFAKRQRTWYRSLSECRSVAVADDEAPQVTAGRVETMARCV
ncbi:MAG: tRNA (adenosine(37)-N6)-dimethylallyltransferase MiaA [Pirellulales bacterium]